MELLPAKATFAPGEPIVVEVRGGADGAPVTLWRLHEPVSESEAVGGWASFPPQPEGGYGVDADGTFTAVDVLADPLARARYGFVTDFAPGRSPDGAAELARRLHLNAVQFYDWMYRHAQLLPPSDDFVDALGRHLSLATVRGLATALLEVGALPIAYAAVYAAGRDEWPAWAADGLYRPDGRPWTLGDDFLWIVDPTSPRWRRHFADGLNAAQTAVGFAGFHLDQYGAPKHALRRDGTAVDLATAFPELVDALAGELPGARLIFNNVNNFPTWTTAGTGQAAVYIEVWPPHDRLGDLAALITQAHALAPAKSVVLAAYLAPFAVRDDERARASQALLLATAFSHGATVLLHGEAHGLLTEAYYVRHHEMTDDTEASARRFYDFAVRYGDLLFDRDGVEVTTSYLGGVNEELRIAAPVPLSVHGSAGSVWARVIETTAGKVVSLIDLSTQSDDLWNVEKDPLRPLDGVELSVERDASTPCKAWFATPAAPSAHPLPAVSDARYDTFRLPAFETWALVWLRR